MQDAMEPLKRRGEEKLYSSAFVFARKCLMGNGKILRANAAFFEGMQFFFLPKNATFLGGMQKFFKRTQCFLRETAKVLPANAKFLREMWTQQRFLEERKILASECSVSRVNTKVLPANAKFLNRTRKLCEQMQSFVSEGSRGTQRFLKECKYLARKFKVSQGKAKVLQVNATLSGGKLRSFASKCKVSQQNTEALRTNANFFGRNAKFCEQM